MTLRVLDTNIVSALMCRDPSALEQARQCGPKELVLTSVVAAEIAYGIERLDGRTHRRRLLEREYVRLKDVLAWADWDDDAAGAFGRIKAAQEKGGQRLDDWDVAIAASAVALEATVVTRNARHFSRVRGLTTEVW